MMLARGRQTASYSALNARSAVSIRSRAVGLLYGAWRACVTMKKVLRGATELSSRHQKVKAKFVSCCSTAPCGAATALEGLARVVGAACKRWHNIRVDIQNGGRCARKLGLIVLACYGGYCMWIAHMTTLAPCTTLLANDEASSMFVPTRYYVE